MSARCLSTGSSQNRSSTISILTYYRPPRSNAEGGGRTPLIVLSAQRRDRLERRTLRLELGDRVGLAHGEPHDLESLPQPPTRVLVDLDRDGDAPRGHGPGCQVHGQLPARLVLHDLPAQLDVLLLHLSRHESGLAGVTAEDVREP